MTYPSGASRVQEMDAFGRLAAVRQGDGSAVAEYTYSDQAGFWTEEYGNNLVTRIDYDALARPTRMHTAPQGGGTALPDYGYGYDSADNVTYKQYSHQSNEPADLYDYDGLNQLTQAWYGANATEPDKERELNKFPI